MAIATINPATGQTLKTFDEYSDQDIERCLARAADTFRTFRRTSFGERASWMQRTADIL
jgi:succinate-semialdehyde dehydrogenase / glutarate-semialdehyde dehydrogenase